MISSIYPINVSQATELFNNKLKTSLKPNLIHKLLKLELKCSFKKSQDKAVLIRIKCVL